MKDTEKISRYVDVEASESDSTEYSSEDVGPTEELEVQSVKSMAEAESSEAFEEVVEQVSQHNLLPNKFSPKLWLVRVKNGKEKLVLGKLASKEHLISIICKEDMKGYIYVESFTKQKVFEALEGVQGANRSRITLIPLSEMVDVFSDTLPNLGEGKFVRVRSGKYKEDLAQILEVVNTELVRVRMIPRIDGVKGLFDPSKHSCARSKGYYIYKKDCYKDGFLEKEMLAKNVVPTTDMSFEEMEMFGEHRAVLRISDKVKVVRGDLRSVVGVVKNISEENVTLRTEMGEYTLNSDSLAKYFDIGDEVSYKEQNGVVVSVDKGECVVMIGFDKEVKASVGELQPPVFGGQYKVSVNKRPRITRDPLLNREVEIRVGVYKGYRGVVKDVYRDTCRVQLNTDLRDVNVIRGDVSVERPAMPSHVSASTAQRTPEYRTPEYKTPSYGTPGYRTPVHRTPAYADASKPRDDHAHSRFGGAAIVVAKKTHALRDIQNNRYVTDAGSFARAEVEYVAPEKYDRVCVLEGEDSGKSGILVAVNNNISLIRSSDGGLISVPFGSITKAL